jgi:hypothetical protein
LQPPCRAGVVLPCTATLSTPQTTASLPQTSRWKPSTETLLIQTLPPPSIQNYSVSIS